MTPVHRSRGSRLNNKVGLNITDDEFVVLKLKESQEKKNRPRKSRLATNAKTSSKTKNHVQRQKKRSFRDGAREKIETVNDPSIASAIDNLQRVIDFTQTSFEDSSSDEQNLFSLLGE